MKSVACAIACVGAASALPLLQPAVTNGVLLEVGTPTFAAGIRTDCDYEEVMGRNLGHVFASGDETIYKPDSAKDFTVEDAKKAAKTACDDMGPPCGGVVRRGSGGADTTFQLYHGSSLKKDDDASTITYIKEICAFPLPYSNFWKGENMHDEEADGADNDHLEPTPAPAASTDAVGLYQGSPPHRDMGPGKVYKFNHGTNPNVERMRWKLSNGPAYMRVDDGKDHGFKSRIVDGTSQELDVEGCMKQCSKRTDCMSGHYCESGEGTVAGKCFLSGDWDPYGEDPDYDGCNVYRNFRQEYEWVKPVLRLENGNYVKEQWHSKVPIDVAYAQQDQQY
jgi:hypothetical protein